MKITTLITQNPHASGYSTSSGAVSAFAVVQSTQFNKKPALFPEREKPFNELDSLSKL